MGDDKGSNKESKTYTYTYTSKEGEDPFKIFDAFFGDKNKTNKKKGLMQKIQDFGENHVIILFFGLLVVIFIIFYIMSVASWNGGKCLLMVPYFSHSTNESCAGLDSALTNAIYLFITFMIIVIVSSFLRRKK